VKTQAGLVKVGLVALDGTKIAANASRDLNRTLDAIDRQVRAILAEAAELDAAEDAAGRADGQRVPAGLVDPARRRRELVAARQRPEAAKSRLEEQAQARAAKFQDRRDTLNAAVRPRGSRRAASGRGRVTRPRAGTRSRI
jgi:hypothetical protein